MRQPEPRRVIRRGGLAGMIVVAALAAGCGGGASTRTVASLGGHASTEGQSVALTVEQSDRDMISFARCMREHGIPMKDPFHRPGHSGLSIDMPTQDAATAAAYHACEHFIQRDVAAKEAGATPDPPAVLAALTRYARCMRARDIPLLDPTSQGAVSLGNVPASRPISAATRRSSAPPTGRAGACCRRRCTTMGRGRERADADRRAAAGRHRGCAGRIRARGRARRPGGSPASAR